MDGTVCLDVHIFFKLVVFLLYGFDTQVGVIFTKKPLTKLLFFSPHSYECRILLTIHLFFQSIDPSMNKRTILADWLSYSEELLSFMPHARDGYQVHLFLSHCVHFCMLLQ